MNELHLIAINLLYFAAIILTGIFIIYVTCKNNLTPITQWLKLIILLSILVVVALALALTVNSIMELRQEPVIYEGLDQKESIY